MSSFSNADTGNKTADPYTAQNKQEPSLKEKVEDLFTFIDKTKICLMTAQTAGSDLLTSRAMALAAKVRYIPEERLRNSRTYEDVESCNADAI